MKDHFNCPCESYLGKAAELLQAGRAREAISYYEKVIAIHPDDARSYSNMAIGFSQIGETDKALELLDKATQCDPFYKFAWTNKGSMLVEKGLFEDALKCFDTALSIDGDYLDAKFNRGSTLFDLKRYEESIKTYMPALKAYPHNSRAWFCVAKANFVMFGKSQLKGIMEIVDYSLEADPNNGEAKEFKKYLKGL